MSQQLPALVIILPLLAAFCIAAAGWLNQRYCFPLAVVGLGTSLLASLALLVKVLENGGVVYRMGGWMPPWGIAYYVDHLNGLVLVVVAVVGFINLWPSRQCVREEFPDKIGPFYTLYLLFVAGLLGITATGDAFNLYVLLEIAALTGYALIGLGNERAPLASLNYIVIGTIGASFYLLGIGYLYLATGSLNMADIASRLPALYSTRTVQFAFIICMTGLFIKMGFFPFHAWLPNAYAFSPSSAASLIAPLTTKVMIYVMIRMTLTVFMPQFSFTALNLDGLFVWLAVAAIVAGSLLALSQNSLKKMLTYVIVAEVGYMVGGLWLGNRAGITGAILHILNDALMTLCVFLVAGSLATVKRGDDFKALEGLFRKMPLTMAAFVTGALAIIGVPPTCGFFSKWYLISGGLAAGHYGFVAALIFSSLVNIVLFFRIIEIAYFEPLGDHSGNHARGGARTEAPMGMLLPLLLVAVALVVLGLYNGEIAEKIIRFAIPAGIV